MTPHRSKRVRAGLTVEEGSLMLDRTFPGIGRIKRASGQPDTKAGIRNHGLMDAMLTELYLSGKHDYLARLKAKELTPLQLWSAYRAQTLDRLPTADLLVTLSDAMERWVNRSVTGKQNKAQRREAIAILGRLSPHATVGDLPEVLQRYQGKASETPSMFNHVKTHVQRFVAQTLGKGHPLYLKLLTIDPLPVHVKRKRGLTLLEAKALWADPAVSEPARLIFRALCLTGLRPVEYFHRDSWQMLPDRIEVYAGAKGGRPRVIPLVEPITLLTMPMNTLRYQLAKFPDAIVEPYTARRTFMHFMEESGIPRTRRRVYMGHGVRDVSDLYERADLKAYLLEDGAKLRAYLGLEGLALMKASR